MLEVSVLFMLSFAQLFSLTCIKIQSDGLTLPLCGTSSQINVLLFYDDLTQS